MQTSGHKGTRRLEGWGRAVGAAADRAHSDSLLGSRGQCNDICKHRKASPQRCAGLNPKHDFPSKHIDDVIHPPLHPISPAPSVCTTSPPLDLQRNQACSSEAHGRMFCCQETCGRQEIGDPLSASVSQIKELKEDTIKCPCA